MLLLFHFLVSTTGTEVSTHSNIVSVIFPSLQQNAQALAGSSLKIPVHDGLATLLQVDTADP